MSGTMDAEIQNSSPELIQVYMNIMLYILGLPVVFVTKHYIKFDYNFFI